MKKEEIWGKNTSLNERKTNVSNPLRFATNYLQILEYVGSYTTNEDQKYSEI